MRIDQMISKMWSGFTFPSGGNGRVEHGSSSNSEPAQVMLRALSLVRNVLSLPSNLPASRGSRPAGLLPFLEKVQLTSVGIFVYRHKKAAWEKSPSQQMAGYYKSLKSRLTNTLI